MLRRARGLPGRLTRFSRSLTVGVGLAATRFPVAAILTILFSIVSNVEIADLDLGLPPDLPRLLSTIGAAAAASVAMRVGLEARARSGSPSLILLPLLAAFLVGAMLWSGEPLSLFAPALTISAILTIFLAPFVGRGTPRQFWTFTLWTSVGVTLAFFSVLLFVAGLLTILEMVRFLFRVGLGSQAYGHIFVTALTLVGPLFALGRIPRIDGDELTFRSDDRLVAAVRPLFEWVAAPLALITAIVLHLYAGRILVSGDVPAGEIGWIVTFFAMLVLSLRIAIDPFLDAASAPARLFGKAWALMLVVPLALMAYAAWLRIEPEGFTVARYFLVLGGTATTLVLLAQVLPRLRGDIRLVAAIPITLLVLSVFGPWGVAEMVGRSQVGLILRDFAGGAAPTPTLRLDGLSTAERNILRSRILALGEVDQLRRISALVPDERRQSALEALSRPEEARARAYVEALGLSRSEPQNDIRAFSFAAPNGRILRLGGYDFAIINQNVSGLPSGTAGGAGPTLALRSRQLVIRLGAVEDGFSLEELLASLPAGSPGTQTELASVAYDLRSPSGRSIRIQPTWLQAQEDGTPAAAILTVLLRSADWPAGSLGSD